MLEQELKNIWKNSSNAAQINIETDLLVQEFDVKMKSIQKKIKNRDRIEISASIIGIILFSFLAYEIPFPITKFSCILSILWFTYVIIKMRKSQQQNKPEKLSVSFIAQLSNKKALLEKQEKLLNSAAYWYAGPSYLTNIIFIIGLRNPAEYNWTNQLAENLLPITFNEKIGLIIGLAIFNLYIIWLNKRASKKDIQPILNKIEVIQQQLNNSN